MYDEEIIKNLIKSSSGFFTPEVFIEENGDHALYIVSDGFYITVRRQDGVFEERGMKRVVPLPGGGFRTDVVEIDLSLDEGLPHWRDILPEAGEVIHSGNYRAIYRDENTRAFARSL